MGGSSISFFDKFIVKVPIGAHAVYGHLFWQTALASVSGYILYLEIA